MCTGQLNNAILTSNAKLNYERAHDMLWLSNGLCDHLKAVCLFLRAL